LTQRGFAPRSFCREPCASPILFDETDEIIVRDEVLADVDLSSLPYPVLSEFGLERSDERVLAMRFRQEKLGDVSCELGRLFELGRHGAAYVPRGR
jgi:hypothetical protein